MSVLTWVTVLHKSASRPNQNRTADLHDGSEFFHNSAVGVADTEGLAGIFSECAVGHEVVVLILIANILLAFLLAFEDSAEPVKNAIGRLHLLVPLLELTVRVWDTGKGKGANKREAQGHCNEGLHGEAPRASE